MTTKNDVALGVMRAQIGLNAQQFMEARERLVKSTLALVVLDVLPEAPNARWLQLTWSDQIDGLLSFDDLLDQNGDSITHELDDEGDRFYDDLDIGVLEEANRHVWEPFCAPWQGKAARQQFFRIDLVRLKAAYEDGSLLS